MTERPRDACLLQYSNLMTGGVRLYCNVLVAVGSRRLDANFRRKGASPTNHCWCQKTSVIALSCGIKTSAVRCLVLSQSTRACVTDRRKDRQTDGRTDGQNYDFEDRSGIAASHGKNLKIKSKFRMICLIQAYEQSNENRSTVSIKQQSHCSVDCNVQTLYKVT